MVDPGKLIQAAVDLRFPDGTPGDTCRVMLCMDGRAMGKQSQADGILDAMRAAGCTLNNANMQHSLLALVVIPALRISDLGLVDVRSFELVPLFEDQ